jgi:hypothetical protein
MDFICFLYENNGIIKSTSNSFCKIQKKNEPKKGHSEGSGEATSGSISR